MSTSSRFHLVPSVELEVETPQSRQRSQPASDCCCRCRRGRVQGEPAPHRVPLGERPSDALLLDSRQVAGVLGIGRTKAYQLMQRGVLPTVRIDRCVRVSRQALEAWIAARVVDTSTGDLVGRQR